MTEQENIEGRRRRRTQFRTFVGIPVSCEVYCEMGPDGLPDILRAVEVEGSSGFRVLSQAPIDETEVLLIYRQWRRTHGDRILRIQDDDFRELARD